MKICHWPLKVGLWVGLIAILGSPRAQAFSLDLLAGVFQIQAQTESAKGSVENLGAYRLGFNKRLRDRVEISLGYTLVASKTLGGDLAYGFDFGGRYFPLERSSDVDIKTPQAQVVIRELWRPYVSAGFHQRQIQSIRTNYAGFGLGFGVVKNVSKQLSFNGELRYIMLTGPGGSEAQELTLTGGVRVPF